MHPEQQGYQSNKSNSANDMGSTGSGSSSSKTFKSFSHTVSGSSIGSGMYFLDEVRDMELKGLGYTKTTSVGPSTVRVAEAMKKASLSVSATPTATEEAVGLQEKMYRQMIRNEKAGVRKEASTRYADGSYRRYVNLPKKWDGGKMDFKVHVKPQIRSGPMYGISRTTMEQSDPGDVIQEQLVVPSASPANTRIPRRTIFRCEGCSLPFINALPVNCTSCGGSRFVELTVQCGCGNFMASGEFCTSCSNRAARNRNPGPQFVQDWGNPFISDGEIRAMKMEERKREEEVVQLIDGPIGDDWKPKNNN